MHSMHLTSPRTKSPGDLCLCLMEGQGNWLENLQSLTAVPGPQPQVSGLQPLQAEGCRRRACPEAALGLPLEIPSLLGAARTSEPPLFCLNGPFSPGIWRTMATLCKQAVLVLGTTAATKWGLASASWAQAQDPDAAIRGRAHVTLHTLFLLPGMYQTSMSLTPRGSGLLPLIRTLTPCLARSGCPRKSRRMNE